MPLPDREIIMDEVHKLASEARNTLSNAGEPGGATNGSDATPSATPIFLGKAHEVIPHSYVMHFKVQHCKNCGDDTMHSSFYAMSFIRSRVTGQRVTHLIPCDTPLFNLPVETKLVGRIEVPFCHGCETTIDLSDLPPPPSASMLYDLEEPRLKGQKPKEAKTEAKKPSKKATLDDLA